MQQNRMKIATAETNSTAQRKLPEQQHIFTRPPPHLKTNGSNVAVCAQQFLKSASTPQLFVLAPAPREKHRNIQAGLGAPKLKPR